MVKIAVPSQLIALSLVMVSCFSTRCWAAVDLVREGTPVATIVVDRPYDIRFAGPKGGPTDAFAAKALVDWVEKMTGRPMPIASQPLRDGPTIYIGRAAIEQGLTLDDIDSRSHEGYRIQVKGDKLLIAGQNPYATTYAVCHLLEHWGCHYYMALPLGEVYPKRDTVIAEDGLEMSGKPAMLMHEITGEGLGDGLWQVWNGHGGIELDPSDDVVRFYDRETFLEHPEWSALRDGKRQTEKYWFCTTNEGFRDYVADAVIKAIDDGEKNPSITLNASALPCMCKTCRALDDPHSIEPSSGNVSLSNRYAAYVKAVAERVAKVKPNALLSFQVYGDYTLPPTSNIKLPDNVVVWIYPLRACRFHANGTAFCPSRRQLQQVIDGWHHVAAHIGYREYNYNLASALAPFSKLSIWRTISPTWQAKGPRPSTS